MAAQTLVSNLFLLASTSYFWRDKAVRLLLSGTALAWIALAVLGITTYRASPDFVAVHYTIFFGIDLIASKANLLVFPTTGLVIALVNGFLAWLSYKPLRFAASLLLWGACVAEFLLLFSLLLVRLVALQR